MQEQKKTYGAAQKNTRNAVGYMRVANFCDAEEVLKRQKRVLQSFCVGQGYTIRKFYGDIGSGLNLEREGLTEMQKRIAQGGIDAILTVSFDRISRNYADMMNFREFMMETGIDLVSVNEGSYRGYVEATSSFYQNLMEAAAQAGISSADDFEDEEDLGDEI